MTHDPTIAACAPRPVTVSDGLIASDVTRRPGVYDYELPPGVLTLPALPPTRATADH